MNAHVAVPVCKSKITFEMIKQYISASNDRSVLDKEALKEIEAEEDAIERPQEDVAKRKILLEGE